MRNKYKNNGKKEDWREREREEIICSHCRCGTFPIHSGDEFREGLALRSWELSRMRAIYLFTRCQSVDEAVHTEMPDEMNHMPITFKRIARACQEARIGEHHWWVPSVNVHKNSHHVVVLYGIEASIWITWMQKAPYPSPLKRGASIAWTIKYSLWEQATSLIKWHRFQNNSSLNANTKPRTDSTDKHTRDS